MFEFSSSDQSGAFAALHGLYWVCVNLAGERPLAVVVDDIHWADSPSLRFLAYLARRLEGLPVLLAATLRTGEPGTDLALMAEIAEDAATTSVRPGPLSAAPGPSRIRATSATAAALSGPGRTLVVAASSAISAISARSVPGSPVRSVAASSTGSPSSRRAR